jgi:hypothetical protein
MATSSVWYTDIHPSKHFRLGTIKKDNAGNEYVYAKGVASLAANDAVFIDELGVSTRAVTGANLVGPIGCSMTANTSATQYSWFQIGGTGTVNALAACADNAALFLTSTAGSLDDSGAGAETFVYNIWTRSALTSSNNVTVQMNRPFVTNQALD